MSAYIRTLPGRNLLTLYGNHHRVDTHHSPGDPSKRLPQREYEHPGDLFRPIW